MVKEHELEPKLVTVFESAVREYARLFGLSEWDIAVSSKKDDNGDMASVALIYAARAANIAIDTGFDADEEEVRKSALHEILHLVLSDYREIVDSLLAEDDAVGRRRADAAEHSIINRVMSAMEQGK